MHHAQSGRFSRCLLLVALGGNPAEDAVGYHNVYHAQTCRQGPRVELILQSALRFFGNSAHVPHVPDPTPGDARGRMLFEIGERRALQGDESWLAKLHHWVVTHGTALADSAVP